MKRIGLLVLVGVWAVLGFAQECVMDSVQMDLRTAFLKATVLRAFTKNTMSIALMAGATPFPTP